MPTRLILIRHGVTDWNQEKKYSGFTDIGLNPDGKKQVKKLSQRLKRQEIHKVYSSDRKRALQSARIIFKQMRITLVPGIREMHFGIFEGLTYKRIMRQYPEIYRKWLKHPFGAGIPEGETLADFQKRVTGSIKKITSMNRNKTTAVVCHGGTISVYINHILKSKDFWTQIPHSASVTIVEYKNGKPEIKLFNDISHLFP